MVHERHHRLRTLRLPYVLTFGQLTLYHLGIVVIQWSWNELSAYPCIRHTHRISSGSPVPDRPTAISDHFIHRTYRSYSSCRYRSFGTLSIWCMIFCFSWFSSWISSTVSLSIRSIRSIMFRSLSVFGEDCTRSLLKSIPLIAYMSSRRSSRIFCRRATRWVM